MARTNSTFCLSRMVWGGDVPGAVVGVVGLVEIPVSVFVVENAVVTFTLPGHRVSYPCRDYRAAVASPNCQSQLRASSNPSHSSGMASSSIALLISR